MRKVSAVKTTAPKPVSGKRATRVAKSAKRAAVAAGSVARPRKPVATAAAPSVRERILEVAERLFAEHGMSGVGLRAITAEAEVNLASIAYHFGSKDGLLEALFAQRAAPIAHERLRLLGAAATRRARAAARKHPRCFPASGADARHRSRNSAARPSSSCARDWPPSRKRYRARSCRRPSICRASTSSTRSRKRCRNCRAPRSSGASTSCSAPCSTPWPIRAASRR